VAPVLVFVVTFAVFARSMWAGFVEFDDPAILAVKKQWAGFGPEQIEWMFTTTDLGNYQPLTWLSYAVDDLLWGFSPAGVHFTNVLIHVLNAVLVYFLALSLFRLSVPNTRAPESEPSAGQRLGAICASLLFSLHPLRVESVAWITERRDVLSTFFLLLATLAYLRHGREHAGGLLAGGHTSSRRWKWYALCLAFLILSLLSKAWGMTFIAIAVVLDIYPLRRLSLAPSSWLREPARGALLEKIPIAVICVAFAAQAAHAQTFRPEVVIDLNNWGYAARAAQACYGITFYLWKLLWPTRLAALYELPMPFDPHDPRWVVGAAGAAALLVAAIALLRRCPAFTAAAACYVILVSPVLGVFQSGPQLVADRYSYVASIPWTVAIGAFAWLAASRAGRRSFAIVTAAVCAVSAALAMLSWRQMWYWKDSEQLFRHALDVAWDGPMLRTYYGVQLLGGRRPAEALAEFERSLVLSPDKGPVWYYKAETLAVLHRYADADAAYRRAATLLIDGWRADMARGDMYHEDVKDPAACRAALEAAISRMASSPVKSGKPYVRLAQVLSESDDMEGCARMLQQAATFSDTHDEAVRYLREMGQ
jgi:tetratricopeptide (TPR) repeat protein